MQVAVPGVRHGGDPDAAAPSDRGDRRDRLGQPGPRHGDVLHQHPAQPLQCGQGGPAGGQQELGPLGVRREVDPLGEGLDDRADGVDLRVRAEPVRLDQQERSAAAAAVSKSANQAARVAVRTGIGRSRTVAPTMTPRVPSDPTNRLVRS
ncbi:hypothetical protein GCM10023175_27830 [Pseudonocardia xishanensis]|uniref:Uncharacterized protein n=1 Tax=Pseudonocardia xishanensis TaxID=630995 RepID=A0ABP8RRH0_9PSEU